MTSQDYQIVGEPRGQTLRALLAISSRFCDEFLVAHTKLTLSDRGVQLCDALSEFLIECADTDEYPAGRLAWGTIRVCRYALTPASLGVIESACDHLFDWQEPALPNDLCLMRGSQAWLVTMASDRTAVLSLDPDQREVVCTAVPGLRLRPIEPTATSGD